MQLDVWSWLSLSIRICHYCATVVVIGGHFALLVVGRHEKNNNKLFKNVTRYLRLGALLGVVAAILFFFIQVGAFAGAGLSGMFNLSLAAIIFDSPIGTATTLMLLGFALLVVLSFCFQSQTRRNFYWPVAGCGVLIVTGAYWPLGHLVDEQFVVRLLLLVHVIAISFWLGSLYPLLLVEHHCERQTVKEIMRCFGNVAIIIVVALVLCGLALAYSLVGSWDALFTTSYGRVLIVKIVLVAMLLSLAAINKLALVPRLVDKTSCMRLATTIKLEMVVGSLILMTTAVLTMVIGIEHG